MINAPLPDDPALLKDLLMQQRRQHFHQTRTMRARMDSMEAAMQARIQGLEQALGNSEARKQAAEEKNVQFTQSLNEFQRKLNDLSMEKQRLEYQLMVLRKRYYGPRADKVGVGQMLLEFAELLEQKPLDALPVPPEAAASDMSASNGTPSTLPPTVPAASRRLRAGRRNPVDMAHLPVERHIHDLPEDQRACPVCQNQRKEMGRNTSSMLEYVPAHFVHVIHEQVKYVCRHCDVSASEAGPQIVLAQKPVAPIEKGLPGPGLLAHIATSKFADHLPLYRLEGIFARHGLELTRGTMCQWLADVGDLVKPVYEAMCQAVRQSHVVGTDDTVMPLLAPEKTRKARMWIYRGDEEHPYNVFDFTESRSRDGPAEFLKGFTQTLLADAYGGYDGICVEGGMTKAGCWAHARRKFVDTRPTSPQIGDEALRLIGLLFGLEQQAQDQSLPPEQLLVIRQTKSVPLLEELHQKLLHWKNQVLPKHPISIAIGYCLNQWESLQVFTRDPAVAMDNNRAEQEMKRIALGRKNFLFVGSPRGGQTAAILASMTSTCRRQEINPQLYLTQLLANLPTTPKDQLSLWLPDAWKHRQLAENKSVLLTERK